VSRSGAQSKDRFKVVLGYAMSTFVAHRSAQILPRKSSRKLVGVFIDDSSGSVRHFEFQVCFMSRAYTAGFKGSIARQRSFERSDATTIPRPFGRSMFATRKADVLQELADGLFMATTNFPCIGTFTPSMPSISANNVMRGSISVTSLARKSG